MKDTSRPKLWVAVLLLGSLTMFPSLSIDMYLPAFPMIEEELQTNTSFTQLSLTFFLIGLSIGQFCIGPLSDVHGRRVPLLIGLTCYSASSLLCAVSINIEMLIVFRFIQGFAGAASIVICNAVVRDLYSGTQLIKFFSLLSLVTGAGPIFAPIVGAQLLRITDWSGIFIVLSGLCVCILLFVMVLLPETLPAERRSEGGIKNTLITYRRIVADRQFMGYALSRGLVVAAMFAYISGSPFLIQNIYDASPQLFGLLFAMNGLGFIIAAQITGRLAGKIDAEKLLVSGLVIAATGGIAFLLLILADAGLFAVLPPLFLIVASVGVVNTASTSLAMQNQGQSAGSASALIGLISFIAGGIVSPFVGLGGGETALPMGLVIAFAHIGAVLCYVVLVRRTMVQNVQA